MTARVLKVEAPALRLDPEEALAGIDWTTVFGSAGRVDVEIGIGKGRFLLAAAEARPDVRYLGVEWANKYLRIAEARALKRGLRNVRFVRADARELLASAIPPASVGAYYVFYPDPWPKKRHLKRRLIRPETAGLFVRTLQPGGALHVATDHEGYWRQIVETLDGHEGFERVPAFGGDDFPLPADEPLTNFEAKYRVEGRCRLRASWRARRAAAVSTAPPERV